MKGTILAWRGVVFALCALGASAQSNTAAPVSTHSSGQTSFTNRALLLDKYCVTCHNQKSATAGLMLDKMNLERAGEDSALWEKVVHKLRTRSMPPAGLPKPDAAGYDSLIARLEDELDRSAAANPNPGRPSIHRLNRAEYTNAIRDLLAIDIDAETLLPIDEVDQGFDNIGDALSVTPVLLERYQSAARLIVRCALGERNARPLSEKYARKPYAVVGTTT